MKPTPYKPRLTKDDLIPHDHFHFEWSNSRAKDLGEFGLLEQLSMGFKLPFIGTSYLFRHPKLLKFAAAPSIMAVIIYSVIFYLVYTFWIADLEWYWWILAILANVIGTFFVTSWIYLPFAGPFLDALIEKIEKKERRLLFINPPTPRPGGMSAMIKSVLVSMVHATIFLILSTTLGLISNCVPGLGHMVALWAVMVITLFANTADYACTLREWTLFEKFGFMLKYIGLFTGFGLVMTPLFAIPFLLPLVIGPGIVGITLMLVWMEQRGFLELPDRRL